MGKPVITWNEAIRRGLAYKVKHGEWPTVKMIRSHRGMGLPNIGAVDRLFEDGPEGYLRELIENEHLGEETFADKSAQQCEEVPKRKCLRCDKLFAPKHAGLYVCNPCKETAEWQDGEDWLGDPCAPAVKGGKRIIRGWEYNEEELATLPSMTDNDVIQQHRVRRPDTLKGGVWPKAIGRPRTPGRFRKRA